MELCLGIAKKMDHLEVVEEAISPLIYKKKLFITNVIKGIQPITKYRKKEFDVVLAKVLLEKLNEVVRTI
jgi:branched-chain amino acid aminotransferase